MASAIPYMRANGGKYLQFPDKEQGQVSLAHFAHGMSLWELFRTEQEVLSDFTAYLSGRREDMVGYWFEIFPAAERIAAMLKESPDDERPLIVDVGGNIGYDLQAFQAKFPEFKGKGKLVLQDLPENIKKARTLLEGSGIESMEYDFFTPQPVKGARIYYFGGVFHDWPDTEALKILQNVAAALAPDSRVIIDEMPLPDEKAPLNLVTYDVLMMINVCGIERSLGHYGKLLDKAGLELVGVSRSSLDSVLEVKLKESS
jgi:SAM-dependent methyltransferase